MANSSIASRSLNPLVWLVVAACVVVDLVVLPVTDPALRWNGFDLDGALPGQVGAFAGYLTTLAAALTIVAMALFFGRRSDQPMTPTTRKWLDGFIAVWVAAAVVSFVLIWVDFKIPTTLRLSWFVPGLIVTLAAARVLWLVPPERRPSGRTVTALDRGLAVALGLAALLEVLGFFDQDAASRSATFLWAALLPIIQTGAVLWLLASPHPQPLRGRDRALLVASVPVLATVGFYVYVLFFGGGLRMTIALVTILIPLVMVYLAYWAWEHLENEPLDFGIDGIDWAVVPESVRTASEID